MFGWVIPAWVRWAALAAIAASLFGTGWYQGSTRANAKWEAERDHEARVDAQAVAAELKKAITTAASIAATLSDAARHVAEAKTQTVTVTREVQRVVQANPDYAGCRMPDDLVRLRAGQVEASRRAAARARAASGE